MTRVAGFGHRAESIITNKKQSKLAELRFGDVDSFEKNAYQLAKTLEKPYEEAALKYNNAWWDFTTLGTAETAVKVQAANQPPHTNVEEYQKLEALVQSKDYKTCRDDVLKAYLKRLIHLLKPEASEIRALIHGKELELQQWRSRFFKEPWQCNELTRYKPAGSEKTYGEKVLELADLRNKAAQLSGSANYYDFVLKEQGLNITEIDPVINELRSCVKKFNVIVKALRGNEAYRKKLIEWDGILEEAVQKQTARTLLRKSAGLMNLSMEEVLKQADLYIDPEGSSKQSNNICFMVNPPMDVRALTNSPREQGEMYVYDVKNLLHEVLMHAAAHAKNIDPSLPFVLRGVPPITAEALALLGESLIHNEEWLHRVLGIPLETIAEYRPYIRFNDLDDSLLTLGMTIAEYLKERALYENPTQAPKKVFFEVLTELSYDDGDNSPLAEDWAETPHIVTLPADQHNYILGEVVQAQIREQMEKECGGVFNRKAGDFFRKYLSCGLSYSDPELVRRITGHPINAQPLIRQMQKLADEAAAYKKE